MSDALKEHDRRVRIGGRTITNLSFTDGTDALSELQNHQRQESKIGRSTTEDFFSLRVRSRVGDWFRKCRC